MPHTQAGKVGAIAERIAAGDNIPGYRVRTGRGFILMESQEVEGGCIVVDPLIVLDANQLHDALTELNLTPLDEGEEPSRMIEYPHGPRIMVWCCRTDNGDIDLPRQERPDIA